MNEPLGSIFISYRRDDTADVAGRLYDRLAHHFGEESVFKDVDSIPLGADFRKVLSESVGRCAILVALIGREWLTITDASGRRRLDNPRDFVRIEIEAALQRDIPVIPLLVNGASMPAEEELPTSLQNLAYRNAAALRRDPDFRRDVDRLIQALDAYLKQEQGAENVSAPEPPPSAPTPVSAPRAAPATSTSKTRTTQNEAALSTAWQYIVRGNARYKKQDYAGAMGDYNQAITLDPKDARAYFHRGMMLYRTQNKLDEALKDFNQAITLDPKDALAYINRGNIYFDQHKLDEALKDYTQAITLDPKLAVAYYTRGKIYVMRNQRDTAIADFRRARDLAQNPKDRQDAIDQLEALSADVNPERISTIIIVANEGVIKNILQGPLHELTEPYDAVTTDNSEEVLTLLSQRSVPLIITDYNTPGQENIFDLTRAAKTVSPDTRIVLIATELTREVLRLARLHGVSQCLPKPIPLPQFEHTVRDALNR